jgi:hypothetical protein
MRQLSGAGSSKRPGLPQAYVFSTEYVHTYTIAEITLSKFDVLGKVTIKVDGTSSGQPTSGQPKPSTNRETLF